MSPQDAWMKLKNWIQMKQNIFGENYENRKNPTERPNDYIRLEGEFQRTKECS